VSTPVRTNPFADDEIFSYLAEYASRSTSLSDRLWYEIQSTFELLSRYPELGEVVPRARLRGAARRVPLRRFPFFVIYRIVDDCVEVMALAHTSRKANYWKSRFN